MALESEIEKQTDLRSDSRTTLEVTQSKEPQSSLLLVGSSVIIKQLKRHNSTDWDQKAAGKQRLS